MMWVTAGLLMLVSAAMLLAWPRSWWIAGGVDVVVWQIVIMSAWRVAWAGTIANVVVLLAVTHGWLTEGPWSFRAHYERDVAAGLGAPGGCAVGYGR